MGKTTNLNWLAGFLNHQQCSTGCLGQAQAVFITTSLLILRTWPEPRPWRTVRPVCGYLSCTFKTWCPIFLWMSYGTYPKKITKKGHMTCQIDAKTEKKTQLSTEISTGDGGFKCFLLSSRTLRKIPMLVKSCSKQRQRTSYSKCPGEHGRYLCPRYWKTQREYCGHTVDGIFFRITWHV